VINFFIDPALTGRGCASGAKKKKELRTLNGEILKNSQRAGVSVTWFIQSIREGGEVREVVILRQVTHGDKAELTQLMGRSLETRASERGIGGGKTGEMHLLALV